MSKAKIIDKKSVESILGEKQLLSELHHPFIVNMIYSFQDHDYLYLVMDLLPGGNLRYHLSIKNHFNEKQVKFLIGCIMIGLEYIHGQNILHRDIKPENLVFDKNGYLRITDFGIAKHYVINNRKDTSGTIGYLAPEVLCNVNHNFSIDYYAVGIITYELMYGHRPYLGKTKHEVKQLILTRQAEIDYDDLPEGFSNETADFINKLIQRKPKNRLGKDSINEVIEHPWFDEFDWENIKKKKLKAPYTPKVGDNFDKKYCLQSNKVSTETMERYKKIMMNQNYNLAFKDFNCKVIPEEFKGYNSKKVNEGLYNANNLSSNISTTSISRNNRNDNKSNNNILVYGQNNINNNDLDLNKKNKNNNEYNDFDKEIFQQIANLNNSLQKLANNKNNNKNNNNNNNINNNNNSININMNNNINKNDSNSNIKNKHKNNDSILYNKSSNNIFRNKDNNYYFNNQNKTYKNENMTKKNINENMNNNNKYLDISSAVKPQNHNNFLNNQKNGLEGIDNDNIIFNEKNLIENLFNKRNDNINKNISINNINISHKPKHLINNSLIDEQSSIISFNNGILKNMKHQYQEFHPNKRNKFLNYSCKDISKIHKNPNNLSQNNIYNNNHNHNHNHNNNNNSVHNINNISNNIYYNKINNNIIQSNNNSIIKKNTSISIPKSKKDYIRKELLKNTTIYQRNHSNLNFDLNKKPSSISSIVYSKKRTNSNGHSTLNSKRLISSHSMYNLKANDETIGEGGINNFTINKTKLNFINSDRTLKNESVIEKKLPFINISINKKKAGARGNEIFYVSYGKMNNGVIKDKYVDNNNNLNYDYFTDRIRNKRMKNIGAKINYNNRSVNNFLDNYSKNLK